MRHSGGTSRARLLAKAGLVPRKRPSAQPPGFATSVEQFVRRAAADARSVKTEAVEVAAAQRHHRSFFEPGAYAAVALPTRAMGGNRIGPRLAIDGLPVASARFGVAICTDVLHHVAEPQSVLGELNRALQADGRLYLTAPLVVDPPTTSGGSRQTNRLGMNYLLEAAGFSLDDLQAVRDSTTYAIVARKARPSAVMGLRIPR